MAKLSLLAVLGVAIVVPGIAHAQAYPDRPIRLILPSAPGGQPDIVSRLIANELGKQMGQQVVVDNRPGASSIIGFELIAKATPDGYTFGFVGFPIMTNPSLYAKLPYDTARDFQPVIHSHSSPNLMTVTPSLPIHSVKGLVEHARSNPDKLSYGSAGGGSSMQLAMELLKSMTKTRILQVSYKGIQQAINEAIGGQLHIVCDNLGSILPHVKSARLRALGVTTLKRSPAIPELPTIDEAGIPGYEMVPSAGFAVPAGVSREIVMRLNAEINKALRSSAATERFALMSISIGGGTPERFAEHLRSETAKWGKVIRAAGIKPQ